MFSKIGRSAGCGELGVTIAVHVEKSELSRIWPDRVRTNRRSPWSEYQTAATGPPAGPARLMATESLPSFRQIAAERIAGDAGAWARPSPQQTASPAISLRVILRVVSVRHIHVSPCY